MGAHLDYGSRLSGEAYDKRIVELHQNLPPTLSSEMERRVRREELEAAIDYRLGRNFPKDRRDKLWETEERIEKRRIRLMFKYLFKNLFRKLFLHSAQSLANYVIEEYAKVLNRDELEMFFGKDELEHPSLPVDIEKAE